MTRPLTPASEALLAEMRERYAWWPADEGTRVANILAAIEVEAVARDREGLEREWDEAVEQVHRAFCDPEHEAVGEWDRRMADTLRRRGYRLLALDAPEAQAGEEGSGG